MILFYCLGRIVERSKFKTMHLTQQSIEDLDPFFGKVLFSDNDTEDWDTSDLNKWCTQNDIEKHLKTIRLARVRQESKLTPQLHILAIYQSSASH